MDPNNGMFYVTIIISLIIIGRELMIVVCVCVCVCVCVTMYVLPLDLRDYKFLLSIRAFNG